MRRNLLDTLRRWKEGMKPFVVLKRDVTSRLECFETPPADSTYFTTHIYLLAVLCYNP